MIKPGDEWGEPTGATPDVVMAGDDTALATLVPAPGDPVPLVQFVPDGSELARAVGLTPPAPGTPPRGIALPIDAIETDRGTAMNLVIIGPPPPSLRAWHRSHPFRVTVDGRTLHDGAATTVVIANGQFCGAADLVPRGHPGDGRLEVQVYGVLPSERSTMRHRLATGTHLPHPRIAATSGRTIEVQVGRSGTVVTLDGVTAGRRRSLRASVRHPALRLLI